nr:hypothetical protein [Micromonospora sp. 15K316]
MRHILWVAAFAAARECPTSRAYSEKKRAAGKDHRQAMFALARRRVDFLRALVRDRRPSPDLHRLSAPQPEPKLRRASYFPDRLLTHGQGGSRTSAPGP